MENKETTQNLNIEKLKFIEHKYIQNGNEK